MPLNEKWALVTGAGRGIGYGCALELARQGANVILNDRPDSPDLDRAAHAIQSLGVSCEAIGADVFSRSGCEGLVSAALEAAGRIDILISNPAFAHRSAFLEYEPADFERVIAGTLIGAFHMSQLVARHMAQRSEGKIVFISSVQAEMPLANSCAYGAAKAGLNQLTRSISVELAPYRINVNALEPGWTDTPGERDTFSEEVVQREGRRLPWGRLGTPDDVGKAAAFLASDAADYITGSILPVDGGFRYKDCRSETLIPARDD